jgi:hypothetical protein
MGYSADGEEASESEWRDTTTARPSPTVEGSPLAGGTSAGIEVTVTYHVVLIEGMAHDYPPAALLTLDRSQTGQRNGFIAI